MKIRPLPAPLSMRDPAVLIATGLGSGRLTPAPGTWGTLAAWLLGAYLMEIQGKPAVFLALMAATAIGWWAIEQWEDKSGDHDNGMIVIDEWAGIFLTLLFCTPHWISILAALVLFRVFDILKPFPIGWLDKNVQGPAGVMVDDLMAGIYAGICVWGLSWII